VANEFDNNYNTDLFSFDEEVSDVSSYDSGTLSTATGLDAFRDPRFIAELREYYSKKSQYFDNDADLIDEFYSDQTWASMNSVSLAKQVGEAYTSDDRQVTLMRRMKEVYDSTPNFYEEGGRGAAGLGQNILAAAADPLNLIGFGAGGAAAKAAIRTGGNAVMRKAVTAGAKGEAAAGALTEGAFNALEQVRDQQVGLQDGFSVGELAGATALGGALGGVAGGVFGAAGGAYQKMGRNVAAPGTIARENKKLADLGYTEEDILQMPQPYVGQVLKTDLQRSANPDFIEEEVPEVDVDVDAGAQQAAEIDGDNRTGIDVGREINVAAIDNEIARAAEDLRDNLDNPGNKEAIQARINTLTEMRSLGDRMNNYQAEIADNFASNEPARIDKARRLNTELNNLRALYDQAIENGDPGIIERLRKAEAEFAAKKKKEDATPEATEAAPDVEAQAEEAPAPNLDDFKFSRNSVKEKAVGAGLTPEDFAGQTPSGKNGFTIADVRKIAKNKGVEVQTAARPADATPDVVADVADEAVEQPADINYRSDNQRKTMTKMLEDAGMDEDDLRAMIANGDIDTTDSGALTTQSTKQLRQATKEARDSARLGEGLAERALNALTPIREKLGDDGFFTLLEQEPRVIREILRKTDPKNADELMDAVEAELAQSAFQSRANLTKTQKRRAKILKENLLANNPSMDEDVATTIAEGQALSESFLPKPEPKSQTSSPLGSPPVETTAGRTSRGRLQSFLRRNTDIGDGRTVIGPAPKVIKGTEGAKGNTIYGADQARAYAERELMKDVTDPDGKTRTRREQDMSPVSYVSTGGEEIFGGAATTKSLPGGRKAVKRERAEYGKGYFYDPVTKQNYKDEALMRYMRGEAESAPKADVNIDEPSMPERSRLTQIANDFVDGHGDLDRLIAEVNGVDTKRVKGEVSGNVPDVPNIDADGRILALRPVDPDKPIRVISQKQLQSGADINTLLGKSSIKDFEVGYVDGSATYGTKLAESSFEPFTPGANAPARAFISSYEASKIPVEIADADLDVLLDMAELIPVGDNQSQNPFALLGRLKGAEINKQRLDTILRTAEMSVGWPNIGKANGGGINLNKQGNVVDFVRAMYEFRAKYIPEEIRLPTEALKESQRQFKVHAINFNASEKKEGRRLLEVLSGAGKGSPKFGEPDVAGANGMYRPEQNTVQVAAEQVNPMTPRVHTMVHELAHWAYNNVLSNEDRLTFWDGMQKYMNEGRADEDAILDMNVPDAQLAGAMRLRKDTRSPQEFFADQFMIWANQERLSPKFRDVAYYERMSQYVSPEWWGEVSRYIRNVVDQMMNPNKVDADLVPLFSKIMPEPERAVAAQGGVDAPSSAGGKALVRRMVDFQLIADDLIEAIELDSPEGILHQAQELANRLYGLVGAGSDNTSFGLTKKTNGLSRTLYKRIYDALDMPEEVVASGEFDEFMRTDAYLSGIERRAESVLKAVDGILDGETDGQAMSAFEILDIMIGEGRKTFNNLPDEASKILPDLSLAPRPKPHPYREKMKAIGRNAKRRRNAEKRPAKTEAQVKQQAIEPDVTTTAPTEMEDTFSPRVASTDKIQRAFDQNKNDYGRQLGMELLHRQRAEVQDPSITETGVTDQVVADAVGTEVTYTVGVDKDSVTPSGPFALREAQSQLSQRNPVVAHGMRTLYSRINILTGMQEGEMTIGLLNSIGGDYSRATDTEMFMGDYASDSFKNARNNLRKIAVKIEASDESAVDDLIDLVIGSELVEVGDVQDVFGVETREQAINIIKSSMRKSSNKLNLSNDAIEMVEYVSENIAYLTNGIMPNELKLAHPMIDRFGNMFSPPEASFSSLPGRSTVIRERMSTPMAAEFAGEAFSTATPGRKNAILNFVGNGVGGGDTPVPYFGGRTKGGVVKPEKTGFGRAKRVFMDASDVDERAGLTAEKIASIMEGQSEEAIADMQGLLESRARFQELSAKMRDRAEQGENADVFSAEAEIAEYQISEIDRELDSLFPGQKSAEPVYIKAESVAHFDDAVSYDMRDSSLINAIVNDLMARDAGVTQEKLRLAAEGLSQEMTGTEAHAWLKGLIDPSAKNPATAEREIRTTLGNIGVDSVTETVDGKRSLVVFHNENVRPVDDTYFDNTSIDSDIGFGAKPAIRAVNNAFMSTAFEGLQLNGQHATSLGVALDQSGMAPSATSGMIKMSKGKVPDSREAGAMGRLWNKGFLENSERLRRDGLNWFADWIAPSREAGTGHFERVNGKTGSILVPLFKQLRSLKDSPGTLNSWLRSQTQYTFMPEKFRAKQPGSHRKIVNALRRPTGNRYEQSMDAAERAAYKNIRGIFDRLHGEMKDQGVMIGAVNNYFPQVWNVEKIRQNEDAFLKSMANYFKRESMDRDAPLNDNQALETARRVMGNLIDDDGVYTPPPTGGSRDVTGDHLDYQRLIRLDKFVEELDDVGNYLEDDLEAIMSKYVDGAVRRIDFSQKFGQQSHGFHDYMLVIEDSGDMTQSIGHLLSTNKIAKRELRSFESNTNDTVDIGSLERITPMPFQDRAGGVEAAKEAISRAQEGSAAVKDYLMSLDTSTNAIDKGVYEKRVDAITGAIMDRQALGSRPHADVVKGANGVMRAIMRKPVDASSVNFSGAHTFSKNMRNFNSVTLLGFTTLTSLGDPALSAIRTGSLKSWSQGMAKYAADPHYRDFIRSSGVAIENIVHERMTGLYGSVSSKNTVAFFNGTMLTPWTNTQREMAGAVGFEWFKSEFNRAITNFNPQAPLTAQNRTFKKAYRILRRYGLDDMLAQNRRIDNVSDFNEMPELRSAINKFANESIFTPNPNDIPLWAQTPVGAMIFQLKSYPLMLQRMVGDSIKQATQVDPVTGGGRRFGPLLMLASVAPAAGAGTLAVKDVVQRRGEDGDNLRERSAQEMAERLGFDPGLHGDVDAFLGWYLEGFVMLGGLGLLADMMYQTTEQVDQGGAYGAMRTAGVAGGPWVGTLWAGYDVVSGGWDAAMRGDENGTGKERNAMRAVAQRIPVAGGIRSLREDLVDKVAGEPTKPGKKSSGWNTNWTKDWD